MRLGGPLLLLLLAPPCADGVGKSKRASKKEKESLLIPLSARNIKDYLDASVPGVVTGRVWLGCGQSLGRVWGKYW